MELCTSRHLLLSVFILQMIAVSIRQVFDFLGYMWASVFANFTYTILIIFGVFGVVQSRTKYTIVYTVSSSVWILWNIFIMCIYFEVLGLERMKNVLSFGTESSSWWEVSGPGCKAVFLANQTTLEEDSYLQIRPDVVTGCIVDYRYAEAAQAIIQAVLAMWGCIFGVKVSHSFLIQDDCSELNKKKENENYSLYSIEYSSRKPDEIDDDNSSGSFEDFDSRGVMAGGIRPMTPRRVKRRSVNSRGTLPPPQYQQRLPPDQQPPPYVRRTYGSNRSLSRSSARKHRASTVHNPVSRFLEQQQQLAYHQQTLNDSSTSNESCRLPSFAQQLSASELTLRRNDAGHENPTFAGDPPLDRPPSARSSYSNYHGVRTVNRAAAQVPTMRRNAPTYSTFFAEGPPAYEIQGTVNSETVI